MQKILSNKDNYKDLENYLVSDNKYLLVCGKSFYKSKLYSRLVELIENKNLNITFFDKFKPNPTYESIVDGVSEFKTNNCNSIIAVGGGSAMDVAKCIKLFSTMNDNELYLNQDIIPNDIEFLAIPTTAGTGSEATHFAVIYYNGEKKSIADMSCIPGSVLFDDNFLKTLPDYQKKSTIMDALSHSIESMWSINSNNKSCKYSESAIKLINDNIDGYFNNDESTYNKVLEAANLAGEAINISKTTAGHAMCYKLTSLYGISHGHSAMLVNSELYPYMLDNLDKCVDNRGKEYLISIFSEIASLFGYDDLYNSYDCFRNMLSKYKLYNCNVSENDIDILVSSVNIERLSNNPIKLTSDDIRKIYENLFNKIKENKKCK